MFAHFKQNIKMQILSVHVDVYRNLTYPLSHVKADTKKFRANNLTIVILKDVSSKILY